MTHSELVALAKRWLKNQGCVAFDELSCYHCAEIHDVIGWNGPTSTLIECKTSRSDFHADQKKIVRRYHNVSIGSRRYYLCPSGLLKPEDIPAPWGLIWAKNGKLRTRVWSGRFPEKRQGYEIAFLSTMLKRAQVILGDADLADWLRTAYNKRSNADDNP